MRPAFGARGCPVFTNCHGRRLQSCKALRLAGGLRFSAPDVLPMTPSAEQGRGSGAMGTRSRLHHRPHHHVQSDPLPYHIAAKNRPASSCSCFHSPQPDPAARGRAPLADRGLRRGVQLLGAAAPARARVRRPHVGVQPAVRAPLVDLHPPPLAPGRRLGGRAGAAPPRAPPARPPPPQGRRLLPPPLLPRLLLLGTPPPPSCPDP